MRFITEKTRVHAAFDWNYQKIGVRLFESRGNCGLRFIGQPVAFVEQPHNGEHIPATFQLTLEDAQELIDSLWDCGLRPVGGIGSAGQMAATQEHLRDMRAIAFNNLDIQVPK